MRIIPSKRAPQRRLISILAKTGRSFAFWPGETADTAMESSTPQQGPLTGVVRHELAQFRQSRWIFSFAQKADSHLAVPFVWMS